jgi:hypothetical protein
MGPVKTPEIDAIAARFPLVFEAARRTIGLCHDRGLQGDIVLIVVHDDGYPVLSAISQRAAYAEGLHEEHPVRKDAARAFAGQLGLPPECLYWLICNRASGEQEFSMVVAALTMTAKGSDALS